MLPTYYKNMGRYSCLLADYYFIQLYKRKTMRTIAIGKNIMICEDVMTNDVEISEDEWQLEFEECMRETNNYVSMIGQLKNG